MKKNFGFWPINVEISLNTKPKLRRSWPSASFSCLSLFSCLIVKIQNLFYACVDEGCPAHEVDVIYLDFSKTFDSVPHGRLLYKLSLLSIQGFLHAWFTDYLSSRSQGVVIDSVFSPWVSVTSDIPHGGHLICLMFLARLHLLPCLLMTPSVTVLFAMRKIVYHYNMTYLKCTIGLKTGVCHTIPTNVKYFESPENDAVSWICPP